MLLFRQVGVETIAAVALPFLLLMLAAIVGNAIQHRLIWSAEALAPKFSKISPLAGAKRMFSKVALVNFLKGLIKLAVIGSVLTALLWPARKRLESLISADPVAIIPFVRTLSLQLFGAVVAILAIIAAADYLFQYQQWFERQKMSMREIKEEYKESEGDPKIKAKIRQLRQARRVRQESDLVIDALVTRHEHYRPDHIDQSLEASLNHDQPEERPPARR